MSLIDLLLALGTVAVVPLGLRLGPAAPAVPSWATVTVGAAAAVGIALAPGTGAAALVVPWLAVAAVDALHAAASWSRTGRRLIHLGWPVALGYLTFGAGWLLAHTLELRPADIGPPFVELTAVHFHYAGFVASLYALRTWDRATARRRTAALSTGAVVSAPPIIAVGFTWAGGLQIVGAVLLTAGLFGIAWVVIRDVAPALTDRVARALLVVSAVAVLAPMLLAVQWAVGNNLGTPALSIPAMARTHGVANAVGFAGLGMLGWWRADAVRGSGRRRPRRA